MPYQDKPSSAPAIPFGKEGRSKNINDIISAIAVEGLLALKKDGNYENNFSIGDNTLNALVNQINIRQGSTIKEYDSTGANLLKTLTFGSATTTAQGFRYLDNPIKISNNPTNPLTEIDISAGVMNPDDGSDEVLLPTSMTRSTANDFANGGLLPNGTVLQTNTMYYVFAIYSTSSKLVSFYADTSRINPTLPTSPNNYDKKQYRGAFYVDANGNIATGSYIYPKYGLCDFTYDQGLTDAFHQNDSGAFQNYQIRVPAVQCAAKVRAVSAQDTINAFASISLYQKDKPNNTLVYSGGSDTGVGADSGLVPIPTADSTIAKAWGGQQARRVWQYTNGWIDYET